MFFGRMESVDELTLFLFYLSVLVFRSISYYVVMLWQQQLVFIFHTLWNIGGVLTAIGCIGCTNWLLSTSPTYEVISLPSFNFHPLLHRETCFLSFYFILFFFGFLIFSVFATNSKRRFHFLWSQQSFKEPPVVL